MKPPLTAGILGLGACLPELIRGGDDPVFSAIRGGTEALRAISTGVRERRALAPGEKLVDLMASAARSALASARTSPSEIDRLIGYESLSEYLTPNGLYLLHRELELPARTMVLPLNCDFSNFVLGIAQAAEAIAAGRCGKALVVCGSNWTRFVDHTKPHAALAGDGAGAAVIGASERLAVVDYAVETDSRSFELWTMKARVLEGPDGRYVRLGDDGLPAPTYELARDAAPAFLARGVEIPVRLARRLLAEHGVSPSEVTLIPHQTRALIDAWAAAIEPGAVLHTCESLGNMSHASIPVTLARRAAEVHTPYILLISVGTGSHFAVMLLRTGSQAPSAQREDRP